MNDKQRRFCLEFLVDLNASAAAIRAGYSPRTAAQQGHENLRKHEIQASITEAQEARQERTEITADRVVQELARIGFSSLRDVVAWDGKGLTLRASSELTDDAAATVAEIVQGANGLRVKTHDKLKALDLLARHLNVLDGAGASTDPYEAALLIKTQLQGMLSVSGGADGEAAYEPADGSG